MNFALKELRTGVKKLFAVKTNPLPLSLKASEFTIVCIQEIIQRCKLKKCC